MPTNLPGALPNVPFLWPGEYSPAKYATKVNNASAAAAAAAAASSPREYDYVIVGGGTAGCVLANRLSADCKTSVLVLEAGYSDSRQLFSRIPAGFPFLFQQDADFNYSTEPQPSLNNRRLFWPRGRLLGGCSSINASIYQRCSSTTYDDWGKENPGWEYSLLEPYFDKAEGHKPHPLYTTEKSHHGLDGPWQTGVSQYTSPVSAAVVQASKGLGVPVLKDINNKETQLGGIRVTSTVDAKGRRSSTAQAYLDAKVRARPNLTVGVGVTTTKIVFEGKRAVGVHFAKSKSGQTYQVKARKEVLICSGTINTPQLLMLSGVGPEDELKKQGINVVHHSPGVGQNLVDHLTTSGLLFTLKKEYGLEQLKHELKSGPFFFKWLFTGKGPMSSSLAEAAVFVRSADVNDKEEEKLLEPSAENTPDLELLCAPINYLDHALNKTSPDATMSLGSIHIAPTSRGEIRLKSSSAWDHPLIDPRYLSTENDKRAMIAGLRLTMKIVKQEPLKQLIKKSYDFKRPAQYARFQGRGEYETWSDEDLLDLCRETAFTIYHPVGTAKMGLKEDTLAVVDSQLKVHGIDGLRVVDASIMPTIVRGHPQAAVVAIAEKAADMILRSATAKDSTTTSQLQEKQSL